MATERDDIRWWAKQLYQRNYGRQDGVSPNFASVLLGLIRKSDGDNRRRLALGFPAAVLAMEAWAAAPDEEAWFIGMGVMGSTEDLTPDAVFGGDDDDKS
jgi:hypothetical protein